MSADTTFASLGVPTALTTVLDANGITSPFPIQAATLPDSLAGRDVLGRGRTGSGKTYAFLLPVLARLAASDKPRQPRKPRALILVPTRELATQIDAAMAPLAKALGMTTLTVFGGVGANPQISGLRAGVDIVVACPGRLDRPHPERPRQPGRGRDHRPGRGRPHGRPGLPARRAPADGHDPA